MKRVVMLFAALAFAGAVSAQQYPNRTVRVIVP
jgi:tripartite-type tricarboxylate transporter receptor subunit TctC